MPPTPSALLPSLPPLRPLSSEATSSQLQLQQRLERLQRIGELRPQPPAPGIVGRFKQLMKDYWYVLVPVHVVTSVVWFGGFYLLLKSGVDIVGLLGRLGTSQAIIDYLGRSDAGYLALSYACYKIASPIRYTVTVAGTSLTVSKLKDTGYLKSSSEIRGNIKDKFDEKKEEIEDKRKRKSL